MEISEITENQQKSQKITQINWKSQTIQQIDVNQCKCRKSKSEKTAFSSKGYPVVHSTDGGPFHVTVAVTPPQVLQPKVGLQKPARDPPH